MNKETVISWLQGLAEDDWRECYSDSEVQETARQALDLIDELLKEQEPRVMTLKELAFYDSGIYVETHNGCPEGLTDELWPALVHLYCVSQNGEYGYVSFANWNTDTYDFEAKDYNVNFRCWTSKPTDEQRQAVEWYA